jgi:hypothetical protein
MAEDQPVQLSLTADELELVRTALKLLISTLGREEADELAEVQAVLRRIEQASAA